VKKGVNQVYTGAPGERMLTTCGQRKSATPSNGAYVNKVMKSMYETVSKCIGHSSGRRMTEDGLLHVGHFGRQQLSFPRYRASIRGERAKRMGSGWSVPA
jgi:hypothetical protein